MPTKIHLPDEIFGKKVDGAMQRVLSTKAETPQKNEIPAPNLNGLIYIPEVKLYFTDKRIILGKKWQETKDELKSQNKAMPTPYQFRAFLKYLRDSKKQEDQQIYKEITEVRDPWRSEWLNAKFEKRSNGFYMISEDALINGKYEKQELKLDDCLMKDKTPGISLDKWLDSKTKHGLPPEKINKGNLYYWGPNENRVARFTADSGGASLDCDRAPASTIAALGVFACAEGATP